jgi:hypothetical protein
MATICLKQLIKRNNATGQELLKISHGDDSTRPHMKLFEPSPEYDPPSMGRHLLIVLIGLNFICVDIAINRTTEQLYHGHFSILNCSLLLF